jgi:hypothetical protein
MLFSSHILLLPIATAVYALRGVVNSICTSKQIDSSEVSSKNLHMSINTVRLHSLP